MKSSIGTFALRFAAMAVLFAPAVAAQAQGSSQSICRNVFDWETWKYVQVCNTVSYAPPPQPASPPPKPEAPVQHAPVVNDFVPYDAAAEAQKAQRQSVDHRVPASSSLCPPPYRMTAQDGCQR